MIEVRAAALHFHQIARGDERMGPGITDGLGEARQVTGGTARVGAIERGKTLDRSEWNIVLAAEFGAVEGGVA